MFDHHQSRALANWPRDPAERILAPPFFEIADLAEDLAIRINGLSETQIRPNYDLRSRALGPTMLRSLGDCRDCRAPLHASTSWTMR